MGRDTRGSPELIHHSKASTSHAAARTSARISKDRSHRVLFGLALAQGAASIVAWALLGQPAAMGSAWHAHEMVFGHALAVVGGYLLTRFTAGPLLMIAAVWVAARLAVLLPGMPEELRAVLSVAATSAIVAPAALAFLRGAKKPGNFVFPIVLGGFVAADMLFQFGEVRSAPWATEAGLRLGLGLVVLLMAAMGGRLLGAAASGASQKAGAARIPPQHGLERAVLALLATGFAAGAFAPEASAGPMLLALAGGLLVARMALWAPGLRRSGADVVALAAGQVWLGVGLLAWAAVAVGLPVSGQSALHLSTIGGIGGTLLVMVIRTSAQRERRPPPVRAASVVAGLMGAAALARAFGPPEWAWPAAAFLWVGATLVAASSVFAGRKP